MILAYDLFLLISNLSKIHEREKIIQLFIEGMDEVFKPFKFSYSENIPEDKTSFEIKTGKSFFGVISTSILQSENIEHRVLINNSVLMLAIILEHQEFAPWHLIEDLNLEIERRKDAEKAIQKNLFEHSPVGKVITGLDGSINANKAFCDTLGYTSDEMKSKSLTDLSHPDDIHMSEKMIEELINGRRNFARFEKRYIHKTGSTVFTDVAINLQRDKNGKPEYFMTTINDITDRKLAEEEIIRLNETLEQRVIDRTTQLRAVNSELEAFSYSVSHDLRAPLRAIHSFTSILKEEYKDVLDDEGKRICGIIEDSSVHMGRLIDDLLAFSHAGRAEILYSKLDMNKIVKDVVSNLIIDYDKKRINLKLHNLKIAYGDLAAIRQVWINLISNAIKYSAGNESPEITIGCEIINNRNVYYVKDNGAGFDMQLVDKLFRVFQRLHNKKEFDGNGVGLAIVHRIISKHGGSVWAEGEIGKGAKFYFTLPDKDKDKRLLLHDSKN